VIDNSIYLEEPQMAVAESAWDAYAVFREELTDQEAQARIKQVHAAHIRNLLADDFLSADGAIIQTDIPGHDLSLVDAHFPTLKQRQTTLFSRRGAAFVIGILARRGHPIRAVLQ
jgi:hypothetical protein